ncbi:MULTISPECIES: helix-turn-helix transcriptional regulator [unclassified Streptomyces]|uniref:helix-turn-helix transcriptional regulator n=1 Tax=unclassified Streptomyces TaxID=2593676 RepID=UPI001F2910F1|nr:MULTISPECIES: helix-turn-helix domain-containing protein [unclassified Streptomyces]
MKDAFDLLAEYVGEACGTNHVCYHLDDVQECEVKSHPTYEQLRRRAVDARVKQKSSHLWESLISMGRMADLRGDDKWRMIIVDCLVPFLRGHSWHIHRNFYRDLGDVRSDMLEAALTVWRETASGVPPRDVPELMVKIAVNEAYRRADEHKHESASRDAEILASLEEASLDSTLKASSILHGVNPRDPAVMEQIRGERTGALWQRWGLAETFGRHHADLRAGRRSGLNNATVSATMLARIFVTGGNHYYYTSDMYPKFVDLPAAAEALGIAKTTAYRMVRAGSFPCPPVRMGSAYRVLTQSLMRSMAIPDLVVHADDVENGADHAAGA